MTTNFKQWDEDLGNLESDGTYLVNTARVGGATAGVFPSTTANKLFLQVANMAAALAKSLSDKGYTVEDGSVGTVGHDFDALVAVLSLLATADDIQFSKFVFSEDTGAANAYAATLVPAITAYAEGLLVALDIVNTNTLSASTLAVNGLTAKTITRMGGTPLKGGDLVAGAIAFLWYDGTKFQLMNSAMASGVTNMQMFTYTTSTGPLGTLTPTAGVYTGVTLPVGVTRCFVRVWSGGGGGGGNTANQVGTGGGGGGYSEGFIELSAAEIASGLTITVGIAGAAAFGGANGTTGGTSSVGVHISVTGGAGGYYNSTGAVAGGVPTGGGLNINGEIGSGGTPNTSPMMGGPGGDAPMGGSGAPLVFALGSNGQVGGMAGTFPGGGGGGSAGGGNGTSGAGAAGLIGMYW
jgi:hypothetical protein